MSKDNPLAGDATKLWLAAQRQNCPSEIVLGNLQSPVPGAGARATQAPSNASVEPAPRRG